MRSTSSCPSQAFPSVRFHGHAVAQIELSNGRVFRRSEGWHLELHLIAGTYQIHHAHISNGRTNMVVSVGMLVHAGDEHPTETEISGVHKIEHVREQVAL